MLMNLQVQEVPTAAKDTHDEVGRAPMARCRRISNNVAFLTHRNDVNGVALATSSTKLVRRDFFPHQLLFPFIVALSILSMFSMIVFLPKPMPTQASPVPSKTL